MPDQETDRDDDEVPVSPYRNLVIGSVVAAFVGLGVAFAVGVSEHSTVLGALLFLPVAVLGALTTAIAGATDTAPPVGTDVNTPKFGRSNVSRSIFRVPELDRLRSGTVGVTAVLGAIAVVLLISNDPGRGMVVADLAVLVAGIAGAQARSGQRPTPPPADGPAPGTDPDPSPPAGP